MAKYAADRVRNVSTSGSASTLGCAECHDHKFDPFTNKEFYSLAAFFADVKETAVGRQEQTPFPSPEQADATAAARRADRGGQGGARRADAGTGRGPGGVGEDGPRRAAQGRLPADVTAALAVEPDKRTPQQKQAVSAYFRTVAPQLGDARDRLAKLHRRQEASWSANIPTTLVTTAVPPRTMRVLPRGNWLDDTGEIVTPAVPAFLATPLRPSKEPPGDAARPGALAGRARQPAGRPRVRQSALEAGLRPGTGHDARRLRLAGRLADAIPSCSTGWPCEFIDSGWDVKHVLKLMVMSAPTANRPSRPRSCASATRTTAAGPAEPLPARRRAGPRQRPGGQRPAVAEDRRAERQAVSAGRLLGLPQFPDARVARPTRARTSIAAACTPTGSGRSCTRACWPSTPRRARNAPSSGRGRTRRCRRWCCSNDPTYVEAARVFAARIVREGGADAGGPARLGLPPALSRRRGRTKPRSCCGAARQAPRRNTAPTPTRPHEAAQRRRCAVPPDVDPAELAAWTSVARVLLNLHETITRN